MGDLDKVSLCCTADLQRQSIIFNALKDSGEAEQSLVSHYCASTVRVLFDVMHVWAECLDSTVVWLPEPEVPAGWG